MHKRNPANFSSAEHVTQEQQTPISPPTTVGDRQKLIAGHDGWNDPQPQSSPAAPKRNNNPRWPRRQGPPKQKHVWIKARDIPRKQLTESGSDASFKSDSAGDPAYDIKKLMDWNGDWLPPPVEWSARKGFYPRHLGSTIENWINGHSNQCVKVMDIESPHFLGVVGANSKILIKDVVPRYWLPDTIDNAAPRKFWDEFLQRAPAPLSEADITNNPPYWERWDADVPNSHFMSALVVPEAMIDMDDKENELCRPFAMYSTTERLRELHTFQQKRLLRTQARQNGPIARPVIPSPPLPDKGLHPRCNIYLRPVQPSDIRSIMVGSLFANAIDVMQRSHLCSMC